MTWRLFEFNRITNEEAWWWSFSTGFGNVVDHFHFRSNRRFRDLDLLGSHRFLIDFIIAPLPMEFPSLYQHFYHSPQNGGGWRRVGTQSIIGSYRNLNARGRNPPNWMVPAPLWIYRKLQVGVFGGSDSQFQASNPLSSVISTTPPVGYPPYNIYSNPYYPQVYGRLSIGRSKINLDARLLFVLHGSAIVSIHKLLRRIELSDKNNPNKNCTKSTAFISLRPSIPDLAPIKCM